MSFCIHLTMRQVVSSAQNVIGEKAISLHKEIDPNMPVCVSGKQLVLTHTLHTLINDAAGHLANGKITIKAHVASQKKGALTVNYIVAYSGSCLTPVCSDGALLKTNGPEIEKVKSLIQKEGGSFEEASTPSIGKQYRFSLNYAYEESQKSQNIEPSFIETLFGLSRSLSFPAMKRAFT